MTIDIRASVTITRPRITIGLPEREPSQLYILHMVSEETLLVLNETLVELILCWRPLKNWVFSTEIRD
jgi:hypothetical protein